MEALRWYLVVSLFVSVWAEKTCFRRCLLSCAYSRPRHRPKVFLPSRGGSGGGVPSSFNATKACLLALARVGRAAVFSFALFFLHSSSLTAVMFSPPNQYV